MNLLFDVNITDKNLNNYFYSEHQQYLYDTIKEFHQKGLGYRKISNWFNEGKIREERLNRESDWKIHSVKIIYC